MGGDAEVTAVAVQVNERVAREHPLRVGSQLGAEVVRSIRRKAALQGCKWDAQVGDVTTLAPFPLIMKRGEWERLAKWAEELAQEAEEAEREIALRADLVGRLGLPRALQKVLVDVEPVTPAPGRVVRFDFHFTTDGWRISEANSDVPGGFSEASYFTRLVAEHFPDLSTAGDPAAVWSEVLAQAAGEGGTVALLSAPGYMEDHQVNSFLAARLRERGCVAHLAKPEQIRWRDRKAYLNTAWCSRAVDVIVRFYQSEWISRLPSAMDWRFLFRGGKTFVANPGFAAISESKRFPLVWDELQTRMKTWRALLPETREVRDVRWGSDDGWILKTAMCNTGDTVSVRDLMNARDWRRTLWTALMFSKKSLAQRRFESVAVETPTGLQHVCVGVYTVNGRAAGAYVRMSLKPVIDFAAVDVALLIEDDD